MATFAKATSALCAFILFYGAAEYHPDFQDSLRERVRDTFRKEIGTKEVGGDNRGDRVEAYLKATHLGPGYAWCASFLAWGFNQHGIENPESAWTPDWFADDRTIYHRGQKDKADKEWKPADIIGIYFSSKGRIAHVGAIEEVDGKRVTTIEGNTNDTGSRNGDRVLRKRRYRRQIYAVSRYIP